MLQEYIRTQTVKEVSAVVREVSVGVTIVTRRRRRKKMEGRKEG